MSLFQVMQLILGSTKESFEEVIKLHGLMCRQRVEYNLIKLLLYFTPQYSVR